VEVIPSRSLYETERKKSRQNALVTLDRFRV
jgi:hypothetical protein